MRLIQLSSSNTNFETIHFNKGLNIVLGEKSSSNKKETFNGVGKTISLSLINYMLGGNYEANFYGLTAPPSPIQIFLANPFGVLSKWIIGIYIQYKLFPEYLTPLLFVLGCIGGLVSTNKWQQRLILFLLIFVNFAFYGIAVYAGRIGAVPGNICIRSKYCSRRNRQNWGFGIQGSRADRATVAATGAIPVRVDRRLEI